MKSNRKRYDAAFKARVALEAIKGQRTISEIASDYGIHPNQISQWKKHALDQLPELFSGKQEKQAQDSEQLKAELYQQCELLGLAKSSFYYQPAEVSQFNLLLMKLIDEQYLQTPFYGVPKMTAWLRKQGHLVNHKRVRRLISPTSRCAKASFTWWRCSIGSPDTYCLGRYRQRWTFLFVWKLCKQRCSLISRRFLILIKALNLPLKNLLAF